MGAKILSQERLKELLHYDSDTGVFTCKDKRITVSTTQGYAEFYIEKRRYLGHRLAWLYIYGYFPEIDIDHKNGLKHDNRIANLREASRSENMQNVTKANKNSCSGVRGVSWYSPANKWRAQIMINRKQIHIGYFDAADEAIQARKQAEKQYHPFKVEA